MDFIQELLDKVIIIFNQYGMFLGFILVILESIIPILPLAVFIAINIMAFGNIGGFIISWIGTIIGCLISFVFFKTKISNFYYKKIKNRVMLMGLMKKIDNMKFSTLVVLISIPFSPAFLINVAAGLSKISLKKYFFALLIGKLSIIYFWGYVGTSFFNSISDPKVLFELGVILLIAYIVSKLVVKKINM